MGVKVKMTHHRKSLRTGTLRWGLFRAPGGWCAAAWTSKGLSALLLPRGTKSEVVRGLHEALPEHLLEFLNLPGVPVPGAIERETRRALAGKPFRLPALDISFLTPFQRRILSATLQIPRGQVRTYGWVARRAGCPKGFRAAGQALNRNPVPLFIPCHRVIAGGNRIGGYGGGLDWKVKLLDLEGVKVLKGKDWLVEPS